MKKIKTLKLFENIKWKSVLKDVAKFYLYLALFYGLAIFMMKAHIQWSFDDYIIHAQSDLYSMPSPDFEKIFTSYKEVAQIAGLYVFFLVFFGVFFAAPPKNLKHVVIVTLLIFLINNLRFVGFLKNPLLEILYEFCLFAGFAALPWIISLALHEFRQKKKRDSKIGINS